MIQFAKKFDAAMTATRPGWGWLGQVAVVVLGIHLAADRLDDLVYDGVSWLSLPWPDPNTPAFLASWSAVWLELTVIPWATWTLWLAMQVPASDWEDWKAHASLMAVVRPLFWLPVALTGAWVVGMAAEDLLAPLLPAAAHYVAYGVGALIAWRLGLTGWWAVAKAARAPGRRIDGWWWAPVPILVAGLAVTYGLPIWGLLS